MKLHEIYQKGISDGLYGFSYINPYWTKEELAEWAKGYQEGLKLLEKFRVVNQK